MLAETGLYVEPEETNQLFFVFMAQSPQPGDFCSSNPEDMQFPASRGRWFTELAARNGWNVILVATTLLSPSRDACQTLKHEASFRPEMYKKPGGFWWVDVISVPQCCGPQNLRQAAQVNDIPFAASSNHYMELDLKESQPKKYAEQSPRSQKSVHFGDRNSWEKKGMEFPVGFFNTKLYSNQNETKKILP